MIIVRVDIRLRDGFRSEAGGDRVAARGKDERGHETRLEVGQGSSRTIRCMLH